MNAPMDLSPFPADSAGRCACSRSTKKCCEPTFYFGRVCEFSKGALSPGQWGQYDFQQAFPPILTMASSRKYPAKRYVHDNIQSHLLCCNDSRICGLRLAVRI